MKKIVIVGRGAAGKNFLMKRFEKRCFRHLVSHTTRPIRNGEKEGDEYHFVSKEEFTKMIENNEFVEFQEFNGNYYGTSIEEWGKSDVTILAPKGVENLQKLGMRNQCFVIFLDISSEVIRKRLLERGYDEEKISERFYNDLQEFLYFNDYDLRITNPNF